MTPMLTFAARRLALALAAALFLGAPGLGPLSLLAASPAQAETATATAAEAPVTEVRDMVLGNADAPITIIEYASYTCPHCKTFHDEVFGALKAEYIDTGKVRFVYREVFFDRYGLWAAMVARCGGDTRYFGINAMLFERQKEWLGSGDANEVIANLRTIGRTAGMDDAQLDACLKDEALAKALVQRFEETTTADGVIATPTLFINGEKHSNMSFEDLKAILDAQLG